MALSIVNWNINENIPWYGRLSTSENFTTYFEIDPNNDLTLNKNNIVFDTLDREVEAYARKDYGASYFGDFIHRFKVQLSAVSGYGSAVLHAVSNTYFTLIDMYNNNDGIYFTWQSLAGGVHRFALRDNGAGNGDTYDFGSFQTDPFWIEMQRSGTTLTAKIYSDEFSTLVTTLSCTCNTTAYRYMIGIGSSENGTSAQTLSGTISNLEPGSGIAVEMYLTQADAQAQTNLQASGEASGYGSNLEVTLTNEQSATKPVSLFREEYSWHLIVSGQSSDSAKIFKVKEFVEMEEISHSIYRSSDLITARATAEINAHTHAAIIRNIALGTHLPDIEPGEIAGLNSTRRGVNDLGQIHEHQIIGTTDSLVSEIEIYKYLGLKR